mmetsp:Transcript_64250/g.177746  ORF Transcript_64250/g.177746 Transcript_64250/m.177746 type:complete len:238 (+) Transcript_64250:1474-2187(+)
MATRPPSRTQPAPFHPVCSESCKSGTYNNITGAAACTACQSGYVSNHSMAISCQACPAGRAAPATGSRQCAVCNAGFYSRSGETSCTKCDGGTWSGEGSSECTKCEPGKWSETGTADKCKDCPVGEYQPKNGSTSCLPCQLLLGESSSEGSARCNNCRVRYYSNGEQRSALDGDDDAVDEPWTPNAEWCYPCPDGTLCEVEGVTLEVSEWELWCWSLTCMWRAPPRPLRLTINRQSR